MQRNSQSSDIHQLVLASISDVTPVPELRRMARTISTSLSIENDNTWIEYELSGYLDKVAPSDLPAYRRLKGELVAQNGVGWIPLQFETDDTEFWELIHWVNIATSTVALHETCRQNMDMVFPVPPEVSRVIKVKSLFGDDATITSGRRFRTHQIKQILEEVRSRVHKWALEIEKHPDYANKLYRDIQDPVTTNYINISAAYGPVTGTNLGTVNQSLSINQQRFEELADSLRTQGVVQDEIDSLRVALESDPRTPASVNDFGPQVQSWIGKMLMRAASGAWEIGAGAAGAVLAALIAQYYGLAL